MGHSKSSYPIGNTTKIHGIYQMKNTMSIILLLWAVCSIAISNGNVLRDIDISEDPMVAALKTSSNVDNNDVDLDADSNVPYLEERQEPCKEGKKCCFYL